MNLDKQQRYSRINSILQENGIDILKFKQEFPVNIEWMTWDNMLYHERYISANPQLVEWLITDEEKSKYYPGEIKAYLDLAAPEPSVQSTILFGIESHDPNSSRLEQVRFWLSKGVTSPSIIASTLGTNAGYVSRLIKEIKGCNRI